MHNKTLLSLAIASSIALTGCSDGETSRNDGAASDPNPPSEFTDKTWPVFNPLETPPNFPLPTDLNFADSADGTANGDPEGNPVLRGLDFMDGVSLTAQIDIKFSGGLDENQELNGELDAKSFVSSQQAGGAVIPNPNQNVFLLPLDYPSGDPLVNDGEFPSFEEAIEFQTAQALLENGNTTTANDIFQELATPVARAEIISLDDEADNNVLRLSPLEPLDPKTKYLVVVTNDVDDDDGEPVSRSPQFDGLLRDEPIGSPGLDGLRPVVQGWTQLASGYFGFMSQVFNSESLEPLGFEAPTQDDIAIAFTVSTTAAEDVLQANAAPRTFFESSAKTEARKDAINKLNNGVLNLTDQPVDSDEPADTPINTRIFALLTDQTQRFRLFDQELAAQLTQANAGGVELTFDDVAGTGDNLDTSAAFALQTAAAEAAIDVKESTIETEAAGIEGTLAPSPEFETVTDRATNFYDEGDSPLAPGALPAIAKPQLAQGEIELPYFLGVPEAGDGSAITESSWTTNSVPEGAPSDKVTYRFPFADKTQDVTVPVIATLPNRSITDAIGATPADGWPVVIFQHGVTVDRSASLPLGTALATQCFTLDQTGTPQPTGLDCFATIAIDQPLHGVTPNGDTVDAGLDFVRDLNGDTVAGASDDITERHFNFVADQRLQAVPMTAENAESGRLFINLLNFAASRDNQRQGVMDLLNLNASLGGMEFEQGVGLDTNQVHFVGHSLGGVNGIPFVAVNNAVAGDGINADLPEIQASAFLNTGGHSTKLLENSRNFGPTLILPALAGAELTQGTRNFERYMRVFQGVLDSTDPINFAGSLSESNTLLTMINGDNTVPNAADDMRFGVGPLQTTVNGFQVNGENAPLAGTEPLALEFGAEPTANGNLPAITRFTEGVHGNPVNPEPQDVFNEMVAEIVQLFSTGAVSIRNPNVTE